MNPKLSPRYLLAHFMTPMVSISKTKPAPNKSEVDVTQDVTVDEFEAMEIVDAATGEPEKEITEDMLNEKEAA